MEIRSAYTMVTFGVSIPFGVFDGIAPYTFEVVPNPNTPAGGSITADGVYTAPLKEGVDTIKVTDADGNVATTRVRVGGPLKIVADVIQNFMGLGNDQIAIYNQKIAPVGDSRLYVSISQLTAKTFANTNRFSNGTDEQSVSVFSPLDIMIHSRSTEAALRKEEIIMALNSSYARRQQEMNCIYFGVNSNAIVPVSSEEGAAIPYAFNVSANIQYVSRKSAAVGYYDQFSNIDLKTNP